jgi:hypothetical protein
LLLHCVLAAPALANSKTDVITLYNGDRITGEVSSMANGILTLNTDAMGNVDIEWKEIASVDSRFNFEIRLGNGERVFGVLQPGSAPGAFAFADIFGERSFDWEEIVEIRPVEEEVIDRLEIYVAANYSFTKASGVQQTELNADVSYNDRDATNTLTSRLTVSDTDAEKTTSSRVTAARQTWTDRQNLFRQVSLGFESNDELALDARYTLGAGLGRYFVDTNNRKLTGTLGLQALEERGADGSRQESVEAVLAGTYARWRFDDPELDLSLGASLYPSLTESGRTRAESSARLRWEIVDDLFWNLNAWGSYDSAAIDEEGGEFDWGITTGLGWSF